MLPSHPPLPPGSATMCTLELTEEYCQRHFLLGVLLQEVNSAISFEPLTQRKKAFRVLMNVVAKLDLDDRYQDKVRMLLLLLLLFMLLFWFSSQC